MTTKALTLYETTVGKKIVMAVSGLILFGFLIGHMLGNLQVYLGPKPFNEYAKFLHDNPSLVWATRIAVGGAFLVHVITALQVTLLNWSARPVAYKRKKRIATTLSARTMVWGGAMVLLYIVYHLMHLTYGYTGGLGYEHLPLDANGIPDVYFNVVSSFKVPWCAAVYLVANAVLGFHIYHGAWSMFQSLGLNHRRHNETLRSAASAIALAIVTGFVAVPVGVLAGWVGG